MAKTNNVRQPVAIRVNNIHAPAVKKCTTVQVYIPNSNSQRIERINKAIELARYNLGIDIHVSPIDTRAANAIAGSNISRDIVANLMCSGFRADTVQVFMLNKDIRTEDLAWCFGATHGKFILISDYRIYYSHYPQELKEAMLVYLIEHEIGHAFHAADDIRASGIYDMHCTDPTCVMQQVPTMRDLAEKAKYNLTCRGEREAECFCAHCGDRFHRYYGR
jgi:predicted Zn-dependent protease